MDDIVRLKPQSTYATVSAALTLAKGHRVALVFPEGERTCLHETALLDAISARCHQLGKVAVIIGGDAWLRAHAVAAGFETATTLEDWGDTAPDLQAVRPRRAGRSTPRTPSRRCPTADMARTIPYSDDTASDPWVIEPPDYVIALRKAFVSPSPVVRAPVVTGSLARVLLDEDDDDAIAASERFEEVITGRILETSGVIEQFYPAGSASRHTYGLHHARRAARQNLRSGRTRRTADWRSRRTCGVSGPCHPTHARAEPGVPESPAGFGPRDSRSGWNCLSRLTSSVR